MWYLLFIFVLFIMVGSFFVGGIKGYIWNIEGEFLEFVIIYVNELGFGIVINKDGYYEFWMLFGDYCIVF